MANEQLKEQIADYKTRLQKNRRMKTISFIVVIALVSVAILALVLPAATLEYGKPVCGQEEHVHTEQCYDRQLICARPETGHVHTASCLDDLGVINCGQDADGHMHLQTCYNEQGELVCMLNEDVHVHDVRCIDPATNTIACESKAQHVHGDTCYVLKDNQYVLACEDPSTDHVHTPICLDENGQPICGLEETVELNHQHGNECYVEELVCGKEEHEHNELCYDEVTQSIMKNEEQRQEEAAEGADSETIETGVVEADMTPEEIADAEDQGLLYENDALILAFEVPDKYKDSIKINVTEGDEQEGAVDSDNDGEGDKANEANVDEESNEAADNADVTGEPSEQTFEGTVEEAADVLALSDGANVDEVTSTDDEDEPVYKTTLHFEALLDGEPVVDISELGIIAKLQMKPKIIAPILADIDYNEVADEAKDQIGAAITIVQQPYNAPDTPISEINDEEIDEFVATSEERSATTFALEGDAEVTVEPTANPEFTVQYYAYIPTVQYKDEKDPNLPAVIDITDGNLPKNGIKDLETKTISLKDLGNNKYQIDIQDELTESYVSGVYKYASRPGMEYFDKLLNKTHYKCKEVWVLKPGKDPKSIDREDWTIYTRDDPSYQGNEFYAWKFTNNPKAKDVDPKIASSIYIANDAIIRLAYDATEKEYSSDVEFYDYDISNGWTYRARPPQGEGPGYYQHKTTGETFTDDGKGDDISTSIINWASGLSWWDGNFYTYTQEQAINSSGNYSGSGTKLAFGNANTGTGLGKLKWGNNELNKYNNNSYKGCTFGLVTGLNRDGTIKYADGVQAPRLFNEKGSATGKSPYTEGQYKLTFDRYGDSYTLSSVVDNNGETVVGELGNLVNPDNSKGIHKDIFTNNFWPMDSAPSYSTKTHDMKFGATKTFVDDAEHKLMFGPISQRNDEYGQPDYKFPQSDDGKYHNSYFGMHFGFKFEVDEEYVGPLEYVFFGDDDLWVFLDGELVVDLGGVHSSVGEHVDLRRFLAPEKIAGEHNLQVFYTERGASGSTCFMQYTLPSVTYQATNQETTQLKISKTVEASTDVSQEMYMFNLNLKTGGNEEDVYDFRVYEKTEQGDKFIRSGQIGTNDEFGLQDNQYMVIRNLPLETTFKVEETFDEIQEGWYITSSTVSSKNDVYERVAEGEVLQGQTVSVDYVNKKTYELPATGGEGIDWYWVSGGLILALAAIFMLQRKLVTNEASASRATRNHASPSGSPDSRYSRRVENRSSAEGSARRGSRL